MRHQITVKGVADFSGISKEVKSLHNTLTDTFGKDGIEIFDAKAFEELSAKSSSTFAKLSKDFKTLKKEASDIAKEMKKAVTDETKTSQLVAKRTENLKKQVLLQRDLTALKKIENKVASEGARKGLGDFANVIPIDRRKNKTSSFGSLAKGQVSSAAGHIASELPGIAGPASSIGMAGLNAGKGAAAAGLGTPAIAALSVLAVAAAAAATAISRMVSGFEAYKEVVPKILTLSGMGVNSAQGRGNRAVRGGEQLGFNQSDVLGLQEQENRAFGKTSKRGDENRLINMMTAGRGLGMDAGQIAGGGNQLRAVGGTEQAQKQIGLILEKAMTSGMDKTQASAYLSSAVGLLSDINQGGVSNTNQLLDVMTNLVAKGNMSPEQAAKSLGGINAAISGSSGEANAFFQMAAARGGLGGGSLLGTQFAVRQGLTGVDSGALGKQIGDTNVGKMGMKAISEMGLDDKDFSTKFAKNILDEVSGRFDQTTKEGRAATLGFTGEMFGAKTAPEAAKILALLEKISKGKGNETDKKLLQSLTQDPQEAWREKTLANLDKTALATAETAAALKNGQIELGKASAQALNDLTSALTSLDGVLLKFVNSTSFKELMDTMGALASTFKSIFKDIMDIPDNLEKVFKDFMKDPAEYGKFIGEAIGNSLKEWSDGLLEALDGMIDSLKEAFGIDSDDSPIGAVKKVAGGLADAGQGAAQTAGEFASNLWEGAKSALGMDAPSTFAKSGMGTPARTPAGSTNSPAAAASTTNVNVDTSELVEQQKRTNTLLERSLRTNSPAPKAGRDTSRQQ